ncbi:type II toxin-antitoxin system VapC family toxin [Candidatus Woesearchaeota archaeon]|nr:type II toxin-antitoxin system VapC family toxin [Candidatus Woesearchaeota archaeon]
MRYIDSTVFVGSTLKEPNCDQAVKSFIEDPEGGITASLTWDEYVYLIRKKNGFEASSIASDFFLRIPKLMIIEIGGRTIEKAHHIMVQYRLKPRDAIHVACMLEKGVREIVTDDVDFDKVKEIKRIAIKDAGK